MKTFIVTRFYPLGYEEEIEFNKMDEAIAFAESIVEDGGNAVVTDSDGNDVPLFK